MSLSDRGRSTAVPSVTVDAQDLASIAAIAQAEWGRQEAARASIGFAEWSEGYLGVVDTILSRSLVAADEQPTHPGWSEDPQRTVEAVFNGVAQFSPVTDGNYAVAQANVDPVAYSLAAGFLAAVAAGQVELKGYSHFHNQQVSPVWSRNATPVATYGNPSFSHSFYDMADIDKKSMPAAFSVQLTPDVEEAINRSLMPGPVAEVLGRYTSLNAPVSTVNVTPTTNESIQALAADPVSFAAVTSPESLYGGKSASMTQPDVSDISALMSPELMGPNTGGFRGGSSLADSLMNSTALSGVPTPQDRPSDVPHAGVPTPPDMPSFSPADHQAHNISGAASIADAVLGGFQPSNGLADAMSVQTSRTETPDAVNSLIGNTPSASVSMGHSEMTAPSMSAEMFSPESATQWGGPATQGTQMASLGTSGLADAIGATWGGLQDQGSMEGEDPLGNYSLEALTTAAPELGVPSTAEFSVSPADTLAGEVAGVNAAQSVASPSVSVASEAPAPSAVESVAPDVGGLAEAFSAASVSAPSATDAFADVTMANTAQEVGPVSTATVAPSAPTDQAITPNSVTTTVEPVQTASLAPSVTTAQVAPAVSTAEEVAPAPTAAPVTSQQVAPAPTATPAPTAAPMAAPTAAPTAAPSGMSPGFDPGYGNLPGQTGYTSLFGGLADALSGGGPSPGYASAALTHGDPAMGVHAPNNGSFSFGGSGSASTSDRGFFGGLADALGGLFGGNDGGRSTVGADGYGGSGGMDRGDGGLW